MKFFVCCYLVDLFVTIKRKHCMFVLVLCFITSSIFEKFSPVLFLPQTKLHPLFSCVGVLGLRCRVAAWWFLGHKNPSWHVIKCVLCACMWLILWVRWCSGSKLHLYTSHDFGVFAFYSLLQTCWDLQTKWFRVLCRVDGQTNSVWCDPHVNL